MVQGCRVECVENVGQEMNSGGLAVLTREDNMKLVEFSDDRRWMLVKAGDWSLLNVYAPAKGAQSKVEWFHGIQNLD
jgi:hypothetical protein